MTTALLLWSAALTCAALAIERPTLVAEKYVLDESGSDEDGPYCGIASIHGALRALGIAVDFPSLLYPRYVGSENGSSAEELMRAASDHGAQVVAMTGMTASTLKAIEYPVVLHVSARSAPNLRTFDHWILFLGSHSEKARIVDYPRAAEDVRFSDLLTRWDGLGLVVSKDAISTVSYLKYGFSGFLSIVIVMAVIAIFIRYPLQHAVKTIASNTAPRTYPAIQTCALLGFALVLGIMYHALDDEGLLANSPTSKAMGLAYFPTTIPHIDRKELLTEMGHHRVMIVDARFPKAYREACIPNAVNIPPDMPAQHRHNAFSHLKKDAPIVIYCQSSGCPYSNDLARSLASDGYSDLRVFTGGWEAWQTQLNEGKR